MTTKEIFDEMAKARTELFLKYPPSGVIMIPKKRKKK